MRIDKKPELLAPAGSMEALKAAVAGGCDAVYLGGKSFSARQYAGNFSKEELSEICDFCHLRGVKVYVAVNTLYKDHELGKLLDFIHDLYCMGVDALIIQDIGAAHVIHQLYPELPLHASTQLTTNSLEDVRFLESCGFTKVVLSRELSLDEITTITQNTDTMIETFIHGALCVCYSGQCIMSSMLGGRSGNRGRCAQTCRLPYELWKEDNVVTEGYLLCPKDIQTVTILPKLIDAGIDSLKIEGRMKSAEYVAGVTQIYRKYIDLYCSDPEQYFVDPKDLKILLQLFNRGGFSEGYYETYAGLDMMSTQRPKHWGLKAGFVDSYDGKKGRVNIRTREPLVPGDGIEIWTNTEPHVGSGINKPSKAGEVINIALQGKIEKNNIVYKTYDKELYDELKRVYEKDSRKKLIYGEAKVIVGCPISLKLWDNDGNFSYVEGEVVEKAQQIPISEEKVRQQLLKTGATPFELANLSLQCSANAFVSIKELNRVRRTATEQLEQMILKRSHRDIEKLSPLKEKQFSSNLYEKLINVSVTTPDQFKAAVTSFGVNIIYFELNSTFLSELDIYVEQAHDHGILIYGALPRVWRKQTGEFYQDLLKRLNNSEIDGLLVRSLGEFQLAQSLGREIAVDYNMNVFNRETVKFWNSQEADYICMSPEMNLEELRCASKNCEAIIYGYLPLMTTVQCPIGNYVGDKKNQQYCSQRGTKEKFYLKDRKGILFPLLPDCKQCVCSILNSKPIFAIKFYDEIAASPFGFVRVNFTIEDLEETERILKACRETVLKYNNQSEDTKKLIRLMGDNASTKGHFFRGVE